MVRLLTRVFGRDIALVIIGFLDRPSHAYMVDWKRNVMKDVYNCTFLWQGFDNEGRFIVRMPASFRLRWTYVTEKDLSMVSSYGKPVYKLKYWIKRDICTQIRKHSA